MIRSYYISYRDNFLFTIENIPEGVLEERKEEIRDIILNIVISYEWQFKTDELKNKIKNEVLTLIKPDIRKYKLEKLKNI